MHRDDLETLIAKWEDKAAGIVRDDGTGHYLTALALCMCAAELREALDAPAPVEGKPIAGEWEESGFYSYSRRCIPGADDEGDHVAAAYSNGVWWVYRSPDDADGIASGSSGGREAADAWIRANPDKLTWRIA